MEDIYCCICTFYYTFVDDNNFDKSHTYEVVPYQYPIDNIANGLYDLLLHLQGFHLMSVIGHGPIICVYDGK
jgi:hypothetical protein